MVDPVLGEAIVSVEAKLAEVSVPVLVHGLAQLGVRHEALHRVGRERVREHVRDDVEVLRSDVVGAIQVKVRQVSGFSGRFQIGIFHWNMEQNSRSND